MTIRTLRVLAFAAAPALAAIAVRSPHDPVLDGELRRLLHEEEFVAEVGDRENNTVLTASNFRSAGQIASAARKCPPEQWAGFQLYDPMPEDELRACSGPELVQAVRAAFFRRWIAACRSGWGVGDSG